MKIGTKSILYGAHAFFIHPWFVAAAWWSLYGFPWDPRLWLAFFLHDLGYFGKPNMDGPEGDRHCEWAAWFMGAFFGKHWHNFCLYHSRFYAKSEGTQVSWLCIADKLSLVLTPAWLYLPCVSATGEIDEYMRLADKRTKAGEAKYVSMNVYSDRKEQWYGNVQEYLRRWVSEHKDGKKDSWTPDIKQASDELGTWK